MPKANAKEKRLARERQAATGKPYTACLAEIRAEYASMQPTVTPAGPAPSPAAGLAVEPSSTA